MNNKTIILIFALLFSSQFLSKKCTAQTIFNNRYDLDKGAEAYGSLTYNNNNFYMLGRELDSMNYYAFPPPKAKIGIFKININGIKLWYKQYGNSNYDYFIQNSASINAKGNTFLINSAYLDTFNHAHQYLFEFNNQGDSLLLVHYFENDTSFNVIGADCKIKKNSLYLCGQIDSSTNYGINPQMYLMKTDALGNILWQQTYGGGAYETCTNMDTCSDGGFILGGWTTSYGGNDQDPYIVKTDSNGNFMWQKVFNYNVFSSFEEWPAVVKSTKDGGILAVTTEIQKQVINNNWTKVYFNKYDINGNLLWRKNIGDTLWQTPVFTVKETSNGDIVAVGNNGFYNIIFKLNANGDSLLMKQINWIGGGCQKNHQYGFDIALIDSGGYAVAGFITPDVPGANINNTQDAWLSTYDSLGCQLPNAPYNLTATVTYSGSDTIVNLNWQYNSSNPNELFVVEEYLPNDYAWDIRNDECLDSPLPLSGSISIANTSFTDTLRNKTKATYRVFAVDTTNQLMSCHSNIAVVDLSVGVKETSTLNPLIKVYPNPNKGVFNVELENYKTAQIEVFTISGQLILQQNLIHNTTTINLYNQPKGMYFLKVKVNEQAITKK